MSIVSKQNKKTHLFQIVNGICNRKEAKMKKLLITAILAFSIGLVNAQKVFSVQYESQADVKVFVVDHESEADLNVYKVKYESQAGNNDGKWFFVEYESQAYKKIYFVDYESQADLKIYFAEHESQAGWKNKSKQQLMY
jgi:hypothetical protein